MRRVSLYPKGGDKGPTNCPNCGAPLEGVQCKFCGTYLYNVADLSAENPTFIRLHIGGQWVMLRVLVTDFIFCQEAEPMELYADNAKVATAVTPEYTLHMDMHVVPDAGGIYARKMMDGTQEGDE